MDEKNLYYHYSDYLKSKYGEKVYKLPINLPITCPNRINGKGGCSFCAEVGTGFESQDSSIGVYDQLLKNKEHISKKYNAKKFIAYFQNYTNTYMSLELFKERILEACRFDDIVEISISTRPDCIKKEYLEFLSEIKQEKSIEINIELGLQTANYKTLNKINRGHGLGAFIGAVNLIKEFGFTVCTHLILNLPYDDNEDCIETAGIISALNVDIVKLHSLYISPNTVLCDEFENDKITICSADEYIDRLIMFLEHIPETIAVERLFSRIPEEDSVFSNWGISWWKLKDMFIEKMTEKESFQGKHYVPLYSKGYL